MPTKTPIYRFLVPASGSRFLYSDELPGNAVDPAIIGFSGESTFIEEVVTSSFTPIDLASLRIWHDERGINGPPVSQWNDQVGLIGEDAFFEQVSAGFQPSTGSINGITAVDFTTDYMLGTQQPGFSDLILSDIITSTSYHIFVVASVRSVPVNATSTFGYLLPSIIQDSGGYWYPFNFRYIDASTVEVRGGHWTGSDVTVSAGNLPALNQAVLLEASYNGTTLSLQVNDNAPGTTTAAPIGLPTRRVDIGRNYTGAWYFDGLIANIIVCNSVLSSEERTSVRNYLINKYSITV